MREVTILCNILRRYCKFNFQKLKFFILDGQHSVCGAVPAEGAGLPESRGGGQHGERAHERTDARAHRLSAVYPCRFLC